MSKQLKILVATSAIFLLAAACNKTQTTKPQTNNQPTLQQAHQQPAVTNLNGQPKPQTHQPAGTTTQPAPVQNPNIVTQTVGQATKPESKPGFIIITQTVEGSNLNGPYLQILTGATAQDSLTISHNVAYTNYGSMGIFVQSIDGITPDSKHFWEFFVNGKSSNVGASSYTLKDGDKIEWKVSTISSSGE